MVERNLILVKKTTVSAINEFQKNVEIKSSGAGGVGVKSEH